MALEVELPCPRCRRDLPLFSGGGAGVCAGCAGAYEFIPFPALHAGRAVIRAQAVGEGAEASCFFHVENQAAGVCEGGGRFLCSVCAIPLDGRSLCPGCVAAQQDKLVQNVNSRILYDGLAMTLAFLPILLWPLTLLTAPVALGVAIYGWRKPGSLVRGKRWRLVVAGLVALLEICVWAGILISVWID